MLHAPSRRRAVVRLLVFAFYAALGLLLIEGTGQIAYRLSRGFWLPETDKTFPKLFFEQHPYLAIGARRSVSAEYMGVTHSHNNIGARGTRPTTKKAPGIFRIVTLGGSSTYCIGVGDEDTWPARLERELGPNYEVVNLGVPGYTTVENLTQTALLVDQLEPDLCLYYQGYNDMRNQHVKDLAGDYSTFHGRRFARTLGVNGLRVGNSLATVRGGRWLFRRLLMHRPDDEPYGPTDTAWTRTIDQHALNLYLRNLETIAELGRMRGWKTVYAPQVLMPAKLIPSTFTALIPYVRPEDMMAYQQAYNTAMLEVSLGGKVECAWEMLGEKYEPADFLDQVHMSASGAHKFAARIAPRIRETLAAPRRAPR